MRYNLGYLDKYPVETTGGCLENNPTLSVTFKRPVDPLRLEGAVNKALDAYPLFRTKVEFDTEYYLITNDKPLKILCCREEDRPEFFGENTNGYPWRISYFENKVLFEWNHCVTDGAGAKTFFEDLIRAYFDFDPVVKSQRFLVAPGIEPFYNTKEKGINFFTDPQGYNVKDLPRKNMNLKGKVICHAFECETKEVVDTAHIFNSSVAPLLAVLYSKAVRKHINPEAKNKNVACNITIDVRKTLNYETMHNCVDMRRFTYLDEYENMNIASVSKIYKNKLDICRQEPNIVRSVTERVKVFKMYHILPIRKLLRLIVGIYGKLSRNTDCNFVLTYLGKVELPDEVKEQIVDMDFRLLPDVGQCVISALDFNGKFNLRVQTDFVDETIEEDFLKYSRTVGIHWKDLGCSTFRQSKFKGK